MCFCAFSKVKFNKAELLELCKWIKILIIGWCFYQFVRCTIGWAWCSDDAYHAYTMSKNLINGYGFTPTIGKRVNVSTCPLWTLLTTLGMLICPDEYYTGMALNLFFSWGSFVVLAIYLYEMFSFQRRKITVSDTIIKSIFLLVITKLICGSKGFITYTTSGLENSLLFFLSSIFLIYYFRIYQEKFYFGYKEIFWLAFLEGLIIFTRMDAGLIFLPLCLYAGLNVTNNSLKECFGEYTKRLGIAVLGLVPFLVWEVFSFLYYGMWVPNTALAKLNTGFPQYQYYERGIAYYIVTIDWDFSIVAIPIFFVALSIVVWGLNKFNKKYISYYLIGLGILLYMGYLIYIGGDFMKGRHFTVIFWVSLFAISHLLNDLMQINKKNFTYAIIWSFMCVCMITPLAVANTPVESFINKYAQDIEWVYTDEREVYFPYTGLLNLIENGKSLIWTCPHRGIQWYSGADWYEDRLYDPLLSRLPAIDDNNEWMVGHMIREFPEGYQETLESGENCIVNPSLHEYYDILFEIINGDIFSIDRIRKIIHLNKGDYDYLLDAYILTTR